MSDSEQVKVIQTTPMPPVGGAPPAAPTLSAAEYAAAVAAKIATLPSECCGRCRFYVLTDGACYGVPTKSKRNPTDRGCIHFSEGG